MTKIFWKEWKQITSQEKNAIASLLKAKKILLNTIPLEKIVAIYVKGSFVRREMNKESDVDVVPILADNRYLNMVIRLGKEKQQEIYPVELVPLSILELKNQKRYSGRHDKGPKGLPSIEDFYSYKLIYGKGLDFEKFPHRTTKRKFRGMYTAFNEIFIPLYLNKKMDFYQFSKQIFWITSLEQKLLGNEIPETWKGLAKSIVDKNHPIHDALKYRTKKATSDEKKEFLKKVKKYLNKIEKLNHE